MLVVIIIVALIAAIAIVNGFSNLFMKVLGLDFMFINVRNRLIAYGVVFLLLLEFLREIVVG